MQIQGWMRSLNQFSNGMTKREQLAYASKTFIWINLCPILLTDQLDEWTINKQLTSITFHN